MEPIRTHDALFKFVFGEPEQMAELLRAALPAPIAAAIDWQTLRREPGSFVDKALGERHTDLLFSARLGDITVLLYVVPEHKSKDDRATAWQMARYEVRILEQWQQKHGEDDRLPPVLAFVVYHGDEPWTSPRSPRELVDLNGCSGETAEFLLSRQLHLPYELLDLSRLDEDGIEAMRVSAVTGLALRFLQFLRSCPLAEAGPLIRRWQSLFVELLAHPRGTDVLFALLTWYTARNQADHETLRTVMTLVREEIPPMRSCLDMLLEMGEERGFAKGEERGLAKGMHEVLTSQLRARFGDLPDEVQKRIGHADAETLLRWALRVLAAPSLDAVFSG